MDNICDIAVIKKVVYLINFLLNIDRFSIDKSPPPHFLRSELQSCEFKSNSTNKSFYLCRNFSNQLNILFSLSTLKCSIHTTY